MTIVRVDATLLAKLESLAALDPTFEIFGARTHLHQLRPRLTEAAILRFERDHGIVVPSEYREFLLYVGDGGPGPAYGLVSLQTAGDAAAPFCPVLPDDDRQDHPSAYDGLLYLAEIGCGDQYFLVVTGPLRGEVWIEGNHRVKAADGFLEWYLAWLDGALRDRLLAAVRQDLRAPRRAPALRDHVARWLTLFEADTRPHPRLAHAFMHHYLGDQRRALEVFHAVDDSNNELVPELRELLLAEALAKARDSVPDEELVTHPAAEVWAALASNHATSLSGLTQLASDDTLEVLRALARNPAVASATLERVVHTVTTAPASTAAFVLELVARADHASPNLARQLSMQAGDLAVVVQRGVALGRSTPGDVLAHLATSAVEAVRHGVALNPSTPAELLATLATDRDPVERAAVGYNHAATSAILLSLARDADVSVRAAVAGNDQAPELALLRLATESSYLIADALLRNPALPSRGRELLALRPYHRNTAAVTTPRPDDRDEPAPPTSSVDVHRTLAPGAPALYAFARDAFGHPSFPVVLLGDQQELAGYEMALHPWLTEEQIADLATRPYGYTRARIAARRDAPRDVRIALAADKSPMVRAAVASNPRSPIELAITVASDPDKEARAGAGAHPEMPEAILDALATDPEKSVRGSVGLNPRCPVRLLEALARDPDPEVRGSCTSSGNTPGWVITTLLDDVDAGVSRRARWRAACDSLIATLPRG